MMNQKCTAAQNLKFFLPFHKHKHKPNKPAREVIIYLVKPHITLNNVVVCKGAN